MSGQDKDLVITDKDKPASSGKRNAAVIIGAASLVVLAVVVLAHVCSSAHPVATAAPTAIADLPILPTPELMEKHQVADVQPASPLPQKEVKAEFVALPAPASLRFAVAGPASHAAVAKPTPLCVTEAGPAPAKNSEPATQRPATAILEEAQRVDAEANGALPGLEKARALYQAALEAKLDEKAEKACLSRLTELTNKLILDPKVACKAPKAVFHLVEPGDVAEKIARRYKVNQGQLKRINKLDDKLTVRYGETLKVLPGDVFFKVNRTRLIGTLFIDGVFIRRYPVGIGPDNATQPGTYTVQRKVVNPDWFYEGKRVAFGDPANILGTRWMSLVAPDSGGAAGLGIHGTAQPESVPGRASKGCVRLKNSDAEELFDLMPQGGKVDIQ